MRLEITLHRSRCARVRLEAHHNAARAVDELGARVEILEEHHLRAGLEHERLRHE